MTSRISRSASISVDPSQTFILGIDIGTTSVKVCIVDTATRAVVAIQSKDTQANVPSEEGTEGNKQDVPKIVSSLHSTLSRLPREMLKRVVYIGLCGQMHGVVFWKSQEGWERDGDKLIPKLTSNLYTWQDSRCTKEFLDTLPKPDSHLNVYTGYGCATIFWMARNKPEKLEKFDRAATIQDFVVAMLCGLDVPVMSVQNAAAWGYFNTQKKEWNVEILSKAGFPIKFLPKVVMGGDFAGKIISSAWHLIPEGTPVAASMGDFQCSVLSSINKPSQAVLNISTSAQLAFVMKDGFEPKSIVEVDLAENNEKVGHVQYFPYFEGKYLAVAAALTGGNSLAAFVRMLQQWAVELGANVPQSKIWEKILHSASDQTSTRSKLEIVPTIFGERHAPEQNACVTNIDLGNISLGTVTRALCRGVIQNLHNMMPRSMLQEAGITEVKGSGSALSRNLILQQEFLDIFQIETHVGQGGDSAFGAALACLKNL